MFSISFINSGLSDIKFLGLPKFEDKLLDMFLATIAPAPTTVLIPQVTIFLAIDGEVVDNLEAAVIAAAIIAPSLTLVKLSEKRLGLEIGLLFISLVFDKLLLLIVSGFKLGIVELFKVEALVVLESIILEPSLFSIT